MMNSKREQHKHTGCLKAQASMELLVTLGVILAFTIPVILLLFTITQIGYEDTAKAQADATAKTLAETMNLVYSQGAGAKRDVMLNAPPSTESITVSNGEVIVRIKTAEGYYEGVYPTFAMIGTIRSIENKTGLFVVEVKNDGGTVSVTPG